MQIEVPTGASVLTSLTLPSDSQALLRDGEWHHLATTFAVNDVVSYYIDGVVHASGPAKGLTLHRGVTVGGLYGCGGSKGNPGVTAFHYGVTGNIDELGIWSRALSTAEVEKLYRDGSGLAF